MADYRLFTALLFDFLQPFIRTYRDKPLDFVPIRIKAFFKMWLFYWYISILAYCQKTVNSFNAH